MNESCVASTVDGTLLQMTPGTLFRNMSDRGLDAIYECLSPIPCLAGDPSLVPPWIINACP